jgi:coenzyme F420 hydrogenase subunit beta
MWKSEVPMKNSLARLKEIVENDLCHRCGACSGICASSVIEPNSDQYPTWEERIDKCTDCGLCSRVCPGDSFSFPEHYQKLFNKQADVSMKHGNVIKAFLGYTADPKLRADSTSGGLATQIPLYLLKAGRIKGSFAVRAHPERAWKSCAFVARSAEELELGKYSKYPVCSMNHLFRELHRDPGPYLFTGIPCHIHGLRKMSALSKAINDKIALTVGLFCHSALDHQAIYDMLAYYGIREDELAHVRYRSGKLPGYVHARTRDGRQVGLPYPQVPLDGYRPNAKELLTFLFKFYSPMRCRMCIDATAEFADISMGDPWIKSWQGVPQLKDGYNFIVARTQRGLDVLEEMHDAGVIVLEPFPEARANVAQLPMIEAKRMRAFCNIERRRRTGKAVPEYGIHQTFSRTEQWRAAIHAGTYFAAERSGVRKWLMAFLLSPAGRCVVGLTFFRRHVLQAFWERIKAMFRPVHKTER